MQRLVDRCGSIDSRQPLHVTTGCITMQALRCIGLQTTRFDECVCLHDTATVCKDGYYNGIRTIFITTSL
jgi:hypothetical protein